MSDGGALAGYDARASLLPEGGGAIMPMRGGGALPQDYTQSGYMKSVLDVPRADASAPITGMSGGANGTKKLTLLGKAFTLEDPSALAGEGDLTEAQKAVLGHLSVPADMDFAEKKAILEAIYNHNCLTDPKLALDGSCEPLRALVGALSMALLNKVIEGRITQEKPAKVENMVQIVIKVPIGSLNLRAGAAAAAPAPIPATAAEAAAIPAAGADNPAAEAAVSPQGKVQQSAEQQEQQRIAAEEEKCNNFIKYQLTPEEVSNKRITSDSFQKLINEAKALSMTEQSIRNCLQKKNINIVEKEEAFRAYARQTLTDEQICNNFIARQLSEEEKSSKSIDQARLDELINEAGNLDMTEESIRQCLQKNGIKIKEAAAAGAGPHQGGKRTLRQRPHAKTSNPTRKLRRA